MPKYELMYLVSSQVTDDKVPSVYEQMRTLVTENGATELEETLGEKKKLAYPIGKTKNGFYAVLTFDAPGKAIAKIESKLTTMTSTIIRHILVNIDEHLARKAKDAAKLAANPRKIVEPTETDSTVPATKTKSEEAAVVLDEEPVAKPETIELGSEELDSKIEAALSDDLLK